MPPKYSFSAHFPHPNAPYRWRCINIAYIDISLKYFGNEETIARSYFVQNITQIHDILHGFLGDKLLIYKALYLNVILSQLDILCFTETWLNEEIPDSEIALMVLT